MSRFFERTAMNPKLFGYGFETIARELRTRVWKAAGARSPALAVTAAVPLVIDIDATLVTHSDRENVASDKKDVAGTYKHGHGFAPRRVRGKLTEEPGRGPQDVQIRGIFTAPAASIAVRDPTSRPGRCFTPRRADKLPKPVLAQPAGA
ncbi:hypothetical protein VXJ37_07090 [Arthrobacter nitrophenolicus]